MLWNILSVTGRDYHYHTGLKPPQHTDISLTVFLSTHHEVTFLLLLRHVHNIQAEKLGVSNIPLWATASPQMPPSVFKPPVFCIWCEHVPVFTGEHLVLQMLLDCRIVTEESVSLYRGNKIAVKQVLILQNNSFSLRFFIGSSVLDIAVSNGSRGAGRSELLAEVLQATGCTSPTARQGNQFLLQRPAVVWNLLVSCRACNQCCNKCGPTSCKQCECNVHQSPSDKAAAQGGFFIKLPLLSPPEALNQDWNITEQPLNDRPLSASISQHQQMMHWQVINAEPSWCQ